MNNWNDEIMAEFHRHDLILEAEQAGYAKTDVSSLPYHPGLFARAMSNFGNWMIRAGKHLRKRYEVPAVACDNKPSEGFAG
jgi:hypothetical protein